MSLEPVEVLAATRRGHAHRVRRSGVEGRVRRRSPLQISGRTTGRV